MASKLYIIFICACVTTMPLGCHKATLPPPLDVANDVSIKTCAYFRVDPAKLDPNLTAQQSRRMFMALEDIPLSVPAVDSDSNTLPVQDLPDDLDVDPRKAYLRSRWLIARTR